MFMRTVTFLGVLTLAITAVAAEDDSPTFLSAESAGPDFTIQGEYLGQVESDYGLEKWGAQIIALGDGAFSLVGYRGGLPGDPWQRGDERETAEGKTTGASTRFETDRWAAKVENGVLTVMTPDGLEVGSLKRVTRKSPTLGAKPPEGAVVLFDGTTADKFDGGGMTADKLLKSDCSSKQSFDDHELHLEFRTPFKPFARGQARGNSGVYVQSRYEVQVLDSFGLEGENNECGGIYSISKPKVNMCLPPLSWQTYDIQFTAARYEDGKKVKNGRISIVHNGVLIMDDIELPHDTPGRLAEGPGPAPLFLQGHGNPVVYRNIWVVPK